MVRKILRRARIAGLRFANSRANAQDVFDAIYLRGKWGGAKGELFSGTGSRGPAVDSYVAAVANFIKANSLKSIVDIGCGDFYVGSRLLEKLDASVTYTGLDVSTVVIERNISEFSSSKIAFVKADASKDNVPAAELCLVRQVLQHLSNAEIIGVLRQFVKFRYVIVTEHQPLVVDSFNADKPHGEDTRFVDRSAVFLDKAPFNLTDMKALLEAPANGVNFDDGKIVTFLIETCRLSDEK